MHKKNSFPPYFEKKISQCLYLSTHQLENLFQTKNFSKQFWEEYK